MASIFQLFVYTVDEYKRFANHLPVKSPSAISDEYTEADYIGIQVKLMLLRKYYGSNEKENVNFKRLLSEAKTAFPDKLNEWKALLTEFDQIENQQMEHLLVDGTKLNIYTTIEDSVYGLYLHADENRIIRLENTAESIRFFCTRKYIVEIEALIFRLYDLLVECGVNSQIASTSNRSPMIYLGDTSKNTQAVTASPYWSNIYGHDASDQDVEKSVQETTFEEQKMLALCIAFIDELKETPIQVKKLRKYIHPAARSGWGNFQAAQTFFRSIPKPGFSTRVRYNETKDTAYIRIFPKVDEPFLINTPHVFSEVYEFALGKWFGRWMIYQFGGHLDSIYEKKKNEQTKSGQQ